MSEGELTLRYTGAGGGLPWKEVAFTSCVARRAGEAGRKAAAAAHITNLHHVVCGV